MVVSCSPDPLVVVSSPLVLRPTNEAFLTARRESMSSGDKLPRCDEMTRKTECNEKSLLNNIHRYMQCFL